MGMFTSKTKVGATNPTNTTTMGGTSNDHEMRQPNKISRREPGQHDKGDLLLGDRHVNIRPSFGQWIKHTWLDILTMVVMGAVALGVSRCLMTSDHF